MKSTLLSCLALLGAFTGCLHADPAAPTPALVDSIGFSESTALSDYLLGKDNFIDRNADAYQDWKKRHHIPITFGAWHWFQVDRDKTILGDGYGSRGLRGTYRWYAIIDPKMKVDWGYIDEIGMHAELRYRDTSDKFRAFTPGTFWTYELYGYVNTPVGKIKGGQIWKRFGLDWDNTFWGNPGYFDGFKLDTDYGFSWENTWKVSEGFSVDSFVQYFITEDHVNGSLVGGDAESVAGLSEKNTGVIRIVPKWQLSKDSSFALGLSAQIQGFENSSQFGTDPVQVAYALDATYTWKNFSIFGEAMQAQGAAVPVRYTSGGASDELTAVLGGISYKTGPVLWRVNASASWDHNPSGRQIIFNPGATIQLTKHLSLWAEYVRWDVRNAARVTSRFTDGFQLALNWNL